MPVTKDKITYTKGSHVRSDSADEAIEKFSKNGLGKREATEAIVKCTPE
jgi:hypothetical protein